MSSNFFALELSNLRGTDSNTLLRLYDRVREIHQRSPLQHARAQAGRAVERIARELRKRNVLP